MNIQHLCYCKHIQLMFVLANSPQKVPFTKLLNSNLKYCMHNKINATLYFKPFHNAVKKGDNNQNKLSGELKLVHKPLQHAN